MLENFFYKVKNGMPCTVVFFGGSITAGAGASSYEKCYAGFVTEYLKAVYPEVSFTFVNAGIGATGSSLGVYRCDRDVVSYHPDLVFFEFAVNDYGFPFLDVAQYTEGILRKLRSADPRTDVIMLYNMTMWMSDALNDAKILASRTAQSAVAYYYEGIPQLNVGDALRAPTLAGGGDWHQYTKDCTHPNDAGYAIINSHIEALLKESFADCGATVQPEAHCLPPHLFPVHPMDAAHIEDAFDMPLPEGWTACEKPLAGAYPHYIEADEPGTTLVYRFRGSRLSLFAMMGKDSGDVEISVDGGAFEKRRLWDIHCPAFDRGTEVGMVRDLEEGDHTFTLRVSEEKAERSEGHAIRIGAFLVS